MPDDSMFTAMSAQEAKQFLEELVAEIDHNLDVFKSELKAAGEPWSRISMDESADSLVLIWDYFLTNLTTQPRDASQMDTVPEWVRPWVSAVEFTDAVKRRIVCISLYFARVIQHHCPNIKWAVGSRKQKPTGSERVQEDWRDVSLFDRGELCLGSIARGIIQRPSAQGVRSLACQS